MMRLLRLIPIIAITAIMSSCVAAHDGLAKQTVVVFGTDAKKLKYNGLEIEELNQSNSVRHLGRGMVALEGIKVGGAVAGQGIKSTERIVKPLTQ